MTASWLRWPTRSRLLLVLTLAAVLAVHGWFATRGWTSRFLPGNEFRQTQTALSALFTQRDGYRLDYPLPLFGPPWTAPLEFPLYQWCVAAVSSAGHYPLVAAGRGVSLTCFYLTLPALWLLGRRAGLSPWAGAVGLALVLASPLYIFYSRALLIESMALMWGLWFLAATAEALGTRRHAWLGFAMLAGIAAGLVKITTWMVCLLPLSLLFVHTVWTAGRARSSWAGPEWSRSWTIIAATLPGVVVSLAWVAFADAIKSSHSLTAFLTSAHLRGFTFGSGADRLARDTWTAIAHTGGPAVGSLLLVPAIGVAAVWSGRGRIPALVLLAVFAAAPLIFPILYGRHDYYFYATAWLIPAAAALVSTGLWQRRQRFAAAALVVLCLGGELRSYFQHYAGAQGVLTDGGSALTHALRDITDPDDVLVVAGADWNAFIAFYAERRSLMLRGAESADPQTVAAAFGRLESDSVAALILTRENRANRPLLELAGQVLNIDPEPAIESGDHVVFFNRAVRDRCLRELAGSRYAGLKLLASPKPPRGASEGWVRHLRWPKLFAMMSPAPYRYQAASELTPIEIDGARSYFVQSPGALWFNPPAGRRRISARFGLVDSSYGGDHAPTDGVGVTIVAHPRSGPDRPVAERLLDPAHRPADRGTQTLHADVDLEPGAVLVFRITPGPRGDGAFDWAYWQWIRID